MRWLQSRSGITGFFIYSVLLMLAACLLPPVAMQPGSKHFILVIGILGIWRYSWGIIHYARYWIYQKIYFPRLRRQLENSDENLMPPHMYFW